MNPDTCMPNYHRYRWWSG